MRDRNREIKPKSVKHDLGISHVMLRFERYALETGRFRVVDRYEATTLLPVETQRKPEPFSWRVICRWDGKDAVLPVEPDYPFFLEKQIDGRRHLALYFLEVDNGTETHIPKSTKPWIKKTLLRNNLAYYYTYASGLDKKRFGMPTAGVLWVASKGVARANHIVATARMAATPPGASKPETPNLFRAARLDDIRTAQNFADLSWFNLKGQPTKLFG